MHVVYLGVQTCATLHKPCTGLHRLGRVQNSSFISCNINKAGAGAGGGILAERGSDVLAVWGEINSTLCHIIGMEQNSGNIARDRLVSEADRIIKILDDLEGVSMLERSEKHPDRVRESAAGRMYRQYMAMLIQIAKALDTGHGSEGELSPLREYIASRMGGKVETR